MAQVLILLKEEMVLPVAMQTAMGKDHIVGIVGTLTIDGNHLVLDLNNQVTPATMSIDTLDIETIIQNLPPAMLAALGADAQVLS